MTRFLFIFFFALISTQASAQLLVIGSGKAQACYDYAKRGNQGSREAISTCRDALGDPITVKDEAATLVNLGLLVMRKGELEEAETYYKKALEIQPKITEIYINYGAALIMMNREAEALPLLDKAIDLDTPKMNEALYNRAIIHHRNEDYRSAYNDLQKILKTTPDYKPAQNLLDSYDINRSG